MFRWVYFSIELSVVMANVTMTRYVLRWSNKEKELMEFWRAIVVVMLLL